jgi:hypothetical protein
MNDAGITISLSLVGILGAVSFCPFIPALIRRVSSADRPSRIPVPVLVFLTLAQTSLIVIVSAWAGARLGPPLGLRSGLLDPTDHATGLNIARLALPGLIIGCAGAFAAFHFAKPLVLYLRAIPLTTRLLYGGFTEEVIVRWGLMTCIVWLFSHSRVLGADSATQSYLILAGIIVTNVLFAGGHIPLLRAIKTSFPGKVALVIFIVSLPWGWLFWAFGIESAMIAHMTFHAVVEAMAVWNKGIPEVKT